ncbi:MAG: SMI1/KNR4 family protein [Deltaproteobacteria bacterium]|jgi:hypothetical protein|nr:SMI1/KNR4 family protein [Deltaproteobacteria bacterium]MBW2534809.1 SMI1/KNR4 family protein [Deltaproteobacteria bacterium]
MLQSRAAGEICIDDSLREALAKYRVRMAITGRPVLALDAVEDVERKLGATVPDEVLALLAAAGRDPYQVTVLTEDARELCGLPRRLLAFAHDSHSGVYWCTQAATSPDRDRSVIAWSSVELSAAARWPHLAAFMLEHFDLQRRPSSAERVQLGREVSDLSPKLIAVDEEPPRRVHHPIFGVGVVLREIPGPKAKLDVDFGPSGRRLLLESYVRPVEATGSIPPPGATARADSAAQ